MSDLLALLDTLDGLRKAATDSTRFHATKRYDFGESAYALWPELSTALRTALTTTDGEREVREALAAAGDTDMDNIGHLRTALNLLATERAKAADAARERDELRAALLNESGQGDPPSKGWEWTQTQHQHGVWVRDHMGTMVQRTTSGVWYWTSVLHGFSPDKIRDTAREAMKAADAHTKVTP